MCVTCELDREWTAVLTWGDLMKIVDLFIRSDIPSAREVLIQAATEKGLLWLHAVQQGGSAGEAILLQDDEAIEAVLSQIPESFEVTAL